MSQVEPAGAKMIHEGSRSPEEPGGSLRNQEAHPDWDHLNSQNAGQDTDPGGARKTQA